MEKIKQSVIIFSIVAAVSMSCVTGILILNSNNLSSKLSQEYRIGSVSIPYYISPFVPTSPGLKKFNSTDDLKIFLLDASARAAQESIPTQGGATFGGSVQGGPAMGPFMTPIAPTGAGITVDILWSIIFTLSVVVAGLIIERVIRAYRH